MIKDITSDSSDKDCFTGVRVIRVVSSIPLKIRIGTYAHGVYIYCSTLYIPIRIFSGIKETNDVARAPVGCSR